VVFLNSTRIGGEFRFDEMTVGPPETLGERLVGNSEFIGEVTAGGIPRNLVVPSFECREECLSLLVGQFRPVPVLVIEELIPLPLRRFLFFDVFVVLFNGILMCLSIALVTI
jgi:hypothetical protein